MPCSLSECHTVDNVDVLGPLISFTEQHFNQVVLTSSKTPLSLINVTSVSPLEMMLQPV